MPRDLIEQIMREERAITEVHVTAVSTLNDDARADTIAMVATVLEAINAHVAAIDRALDPRVTPTALRAVADEHERLQARFAAAGLLQRPS